MPKPPPTSPTTTRTSSFGACRACRRRCCRARPMGICVLMRIVVRPVALSKSACTERGSMVTAARRWLVMSSLTTCAAWAKAARRWPAHRRGASRRRCCRAPRRTAPARRARWPASGRPPSAVPRSRRTPPRRRRAPAARVSATTAATRLRRRSAPARAPARGAAGVAAGVPSARTKPATPGTGLTPAATRSAPVKTCATPGIGGGGGADARGSEASQPSMIARL